ncbi:HNH endonuclease [Agrobacterium vitis]|uniref:HNH endonuclease n=1 Tax=Agrobacterium vitis TaxID=373 RepID=UPI00403EB9C7
MSRREFTKATKRAALERSQMKCEAIGAVYGLQEGIRCNGPLAYGLDFDHIIADAIGGDNSLENCAAVCKRCHGYKTRTNDTPKAAKVKRVRDKHLGITNPSSGFNKRYKKCFDGRIIDRITGEVYGK